MVDTLGRRAHDDSDDAQVTDDDYEREVPDSGSQKVETSNLCLMLWCNHHFSLRATMACEW